MTRTHLNWAVAAAVVGFGSVAFVSARQLQQPGMTKANFFVTNKTPLEAIPVTLALVDPKMPNVPVTVAGVAEVRLSDATLNAMDRTDARTKNVVSARQTWEYKEVILSPGTDWAAALNQEGASGWEATGIASPEKEGRVQIILKRPR